jgi:hypothetical protein
MWKYSVSFYSYPQHGRCHDSLIAQKVCIRRQFQVRFPPAGQVNFHRRVPIFSKSPGNAGFLCDEITSLCGMTKWALCIFFRKGLRTTKKILRYNSRTPGRNSKPQLPKYKVQMLTSILSCVTILLVTHINIAVYLLFPFVTHAVWRSLWCHMSTMRILRTP